MLEEDIITRKRDLEEFETRLGSSMRQQHLRLQGVQSKQWQGWAASFASQPPRQYTLLMKTIMQLLNFTFAKASSKEPSTKAAAGLDDAMVLRAAMSVLSSTDFSSKLSKIDALTLSPDQLKLVSEANILLASSDSNAPHLMVMHPVKQKGDSHMLYEILREFISSLEYSSNLQQKISAATDFLETSRNLFVTLEAENRRNLLINDSSYTGLKDRLIRKASLLQEHLREVHTKIDRFRSIAKERDNFHTLIYGSLGFVKRELLQLENVLRVTTADLCIAAVLIVRVGWAPEYIRQMVLYQLRERVVASKHAFTTSPFVLGGLWDQLQFRRWSHYNVDSMPRDICSLNSMSLLLLCPCYCIVIDPEGVAEAAIIDALATDSNIKCVSAQDFTVSALMDWVNASSTAPGDRKRVQARDAHKDLVVLVRDLDAGASADLVSFLAAELKTQTLPTGEVMVFAAFGTWSGSAIPIGHIRLILLSNSAPEVRAGGFASPLPLSCFSNVTMIHWAGSHSQTCLIDPTAVDTALNKSPAADSLLESRMCMSLMKRHFQEHLQRLKTTSDRICSSSVDLLQAEERAVEAVLAATRRSHFNESQSSSKITLGFIPIPLMTLPINFLDSDECRQALRQARESSGVLSRNISSLIAQEKDMLQFHRAITDTIFSMSAEYVRMCTLLIPHSEIFRENVTVASICSSCLDPLFASDPELQRHLKLFPRSFGAASKIFNATLRLQKFVRTVVISIRTIKFDRKLSKRMSSFALSKPTNALTNSKSLHKMSQLSFVSAVDLPVEQRNWLVDVIALFSQPVKAVVLKNVVSFVMKNIQQNSRWLSKLVVLLTASAQAAVLPVAELQSLLEIYRSHMQTTSLCMEGRYLYRLSFQPQKTIFRTVSMAFRTAAAAERRANKPLDELRVIHSFLSQPPTKISPGTDLNFRGSFEIGGLLIGRNCTLWRITPTARESVDELRNIRWELFYEPGIDNGLLLHLNPSMTAPRLSQSFEMEWMSLDGVKVASIGDFEVKTKTAVPERKMTARNMRAPSFAGRRLSKAGDDFAGIGTKPLHPNGPKTSDNLAKGLRKTSFHPMKRPSAPNVPIPTGGSVMGGRKLSFLVHSAHADAVEEDPVEAFWTQIDHMSANLQALFRNYRSQDMAKVADTQVPMMLDSAFSRRYLRLLDKHSELRSIFQGSKSLIMSYKSNFLLWATVVKSLADVKTSEMTPQDMMFLLSHILPPVPTPIDNPDRAINMGSWPAGVELTVIQTFILVGMLLPASLPRLVEIYFINIRHYFELGGVATIYADEVLDDDDEFGSASRAGSIVFHQSFRTTKHGFDRHFSFMNDMDLIVESADDDDNTFSKAGPSRPESMSSMVSFVNNARVNNNTATSGSIRGKKLLKDVLVNNWRLLRRSLSGVIPVATPKYHGVKSKYQLHLRDYENWEACLIAVLTEE